MLEPIFFASAALLIYHYVLYPAIVVILSKCWRMPRTIPLDAPPRVSFIVAAYNEEKVIAAKLRNTLELAYPPDRLEVLVVSDGSSDGTEAIVRSFASRGVISLHQAERRGKTAALNRAVEHATGEFVVFSDANNDFSRDALVRLLSHFVDSGVGGVCGAKRIRQAEGRQSSVGDGLYWRYESALKLAESRIGNITGADGEIFAVRRSLYRPVPEYIINDDAQITLDIVRQGFSVRYEPSAQSFELASIEIKDDFYVKVRMVAGGFQTIVENAGMLFPMRSWFAWAFFSHKTLRWLAPLFLLIAFTSSAMLARQQIYLLVLVTQLVFYGVAAIGYVRIARGALPLAVYVPLYFTAMNLAALGGLIRFLRRRQTVQWRKAQR